MSTGERLTGAQRVRKLQTTLHAKAKEEPERRFHALIDKVWREDFLLEAWKRVRRKGGSAGVDGETIADIEKAGVEGWLGDLSRELRDGTYSAAGGAAGHDPEEGAGQIPTLEHTLPEGPGRADVGHARAGADLRGGPATGTVRLPAGTQCARCGPTASTACCRGGIAKW